MKTKLLSLLPALLLSLTINAQVPIVNSFSPLAAPVGATVSITGNNFSPVAANNTVYFGKVRTTVTAATATSINATVPFGAGYEPISVTRDSLTGFSATNFTVTFAGGVGAAFIGNSFAAAQKLADGGRHCIADFDNDGLPDMAAAITSYRIGIYKNLGTPTEFVLAPPVTFASGFSRSPSQLIAADFNGDGKLDLAATNTATTGFLVYKNSSTAGNIAFDAPQYVPLNFEYGFTLATADIDKDGKTDVITGYASSGRAFSVSRNTSTTATISFAAFVSFSFGPNTGSGGKVRLADLDGDSKTDVAVMDNYYTSLSLFRNTSTPGTISFATKFALPITKPESFSDYYDMQLGDLDGDGKVDIGYTFSQGDSLHIFRNTGTVGNLSFANKITFTNFSYYGPYVFAFTDMDGDAKPDVVVSSYDSAMVLKNNSSIGNINLFNYAKYKSVNTVRNVTLSDMDADGKPDIVLSGSDVSNNNNDTTVKVFVLRNQVNGPVITMVDPPTAGKDSTIIIRGNRFTNTTAVKLGDSAAASFTVLSDTAISAIVGNGTSGKITVTTTTGLTKWAGFTFTLPVPQVYGVQPPIGPVGSTVTIKGKNFNTNASGNVVYFGAALATVTAATDSTLTVTVPTGMSYQPVTVLNGNSLSAASPHPFLTTFDGGIPNFNNNSLSDTMHSVVLPEPLNPIAADFDGDGKTDIAIGARTNNYGVGVFRNIGTNGNVAFAPRVDYYTYSQSICCFTRGAVVIDATDMDGDGKKDVLVLHDSPDSLTILRNVSTPGTLAFAPRKNFLTSSNLLDLVTGDIDGDGKPDAVVKCFVPHPITGSSTPGFSIFKNNSTPGNISMQVRIDKAVGVLHGLILQDMDGDGKLDITAAVGSASSNGRILFYRNISTMGNIAFADSVAYLPNQAFGTLLTADLNGDGKPDWILANYLTQTLSIYKNSSTPGSLLFTDKTDFALPRRVRGIQVGNLSGDGLPDLFFTTDSTNAVVLYKNTGNGSTFGFAPLVNFNRSMSGGVTIAADVSGDGKPDIINSYTYFGSPNNYKMTVLRNQVGELASTALCPGVDSVLLQSGITASTYQWQVDMGSGFNDITDNANYIGTTTANLRIRNIPAAWYGYQYRCVTNVGNSNPYLLQVQSRWLGTVNNSWENPANWSCGRVPNSNSDVIINSGTVVVNSNVTIRSLRLNPNASFTVNSGFTVTVLR